MVILGALLAISIGSAGTAAAAPHALVRTERAVVPRASYWTRARMLAAAGSASSSLAAGGEWVRGALWKGGGAVARTTGRVFFLLDGIDYACSGAVVSGANPDLVVTAAHCVSDGSGGWAQDWTFVPGYVDGRAPYGRYPAQAYYVSGAWGGGADEYHDVAFVAVRPVRVNGALRDVASEVGSQPILFGYRSPAEAVFGYPAEAPFSGRQIDYCHGPVTPDPYGAADAGIPCGMTEGDSGGPWLSDFDPAGGAGIITGVTSFKYAGANRTLYSADLGRVAQALYVSAEHGPSHRSPRRHG